MPGTRRRVTPPEPASGPRAAAGDAGEPLAGNYFVSAYPPFSCWSEATVERYRDRLERPSPAPSPLGLYVHIPFCVERCQYCYYLSHDDRGGEIERYLEAVLGELRLYADRPLIAGRPPLFVYFGGGTPSLLSARRIRRLLSGLQEIVPWTAAREVSFECAPRSVTPAKLEALRELGVTRISLGVQQLDDEVLRLNGRVHLTADVERAWPEIRRAGFPVVNVDLIAGLIGETDRSFQEGLERVLEREPESVTIYLLEIPYNTPLYRSLQEGTVASPPAGWAIKRARLAAAFARLEEAGYTLRSAYTAVRDPERHRFLYQDEQYRGADLLGLGASSFSYLAGFHHQNRATLAGFLESLERERLPLWRAYALDAEEQLVRQLVLQLKLGRLDAAAFRAAFGADPRERFAEPLGRFAEQGWLTVDGDAIVLTREGLTRADRLVRELFLPRHRDIRYS